jgi:hypothetical protein
VQRGLLHRAVIDEALTWLEIHGDRPEVVAHWRELQARPAPAHHHGTPHALAEADATPGPLHRRRRRRRRRRGAPPITRES